MPGQRGRHKTEVRVHWTGSIASGPWRHAANKSCGTDSQLPRSAGVVDTLVGRRVAWALCTARWLFHRRYGTMAEATSCWWHCAVVALLLVMGCLILGRGLNVLSVSYWLLVCVMRACAVLSGAPVRILVAVGRLERPRCGRRSHAQKPCRTETAALLRKTCHSITSQRRYILLTYS